MVDAFVRAPENLRHAALFSASAHRSENAEMIYHKINLGVISEYISYRASLGGAERLGPAVAPGAAGATGAAGKGYPQEESSQDNIPQNIIIEGCCRTT